jgi:hypothetical protein
MMQFFPIVAFSRIWALIQILVLSPILALAATLAVG